MKKLVFLSVCACFSLYSHAQWVSIGATTTSNVYISTGKVGIGYSSAPSVTAQVQCTTSTDNRQIVLNGSVANPYQIAGFGYNTSLLKYFIPANGGTNGHVFYAASSSTAADELLRITGTGLVGIGTNAPADKLHLSGGSNALFRISSADVAATVASNALRVGNNGGTYSWLQAMTSTPVAGNKGTSSTAQANVSVLALNPMGGKVGINTTTPGALLHVKSGDILIEETANGGGLDDNSADLILKDRTGGVLDIFQGNGAGNIQIGGCATECRIGACWYLQGSTTIFSDGKMAIGAKDDGSHMARPTGYRLYVKEGILTEKIKLAVSNDLVNWADYVFDKEYNLKSLTEVEKFISKNKHLPEIPSAKEVYKDGIDVAQMDAKLLMKIEELTLYLIAQQKEVTELRKTVTELSGRLGK